MLIPSDYVATLAEDLADGYKWQLDAKGDCAMVRRLIRPKMAKPEGVANTHFLYLS